MELGWAEAWAWITSLPGFSPAPLSCPQSSSPVNCLHEQPASSFSRVPDPLQGIPAAESGEGPGFPQRSCEKWWRKRILRFRKSSKSQGWEITAITCFSYCGGIAQCQCERSQQTGKFFKRREYQTTWPASWEICMQVKKQQLELDIGQQSVSKYRKGVHQFSSVV